MAFATKLFQVPIDALQRLQKHAFALFDRFLNCRLRCPGVLRIVTELFFQAQTDGHFALDGKRPVESVVLGLPVALELVPVLEFFDFKNRRWPAFLILARQNDALHIAERIVFRELLMQTVHHHFPAIAVYQEAVAGNDGRFKLASVHR